MKHSLHNWYSRDTSLDLGRKVIIYVLVVAGNVCKSRDADQR